MSNFCEASEHWSLLRCVDADCRALIDIFDFFMIQKATCLENQITSAGSPVPDEPDIGADNDDIARI